MAGTRNKSNPQTKKKNDTKSRSKCSIFSIVLSAFFIVWMVGTKLYIQIAYIYVGINEIANADFNLFVYLHIFSITVSDKALNLFCPTGIFLSIIFCCWPYQLEFNGNLNVICSICLLSTFYSIKIIAIIHFRGWIFVFFHILIQNWFAFSMTAPIQNVIN